MPVVDEFDVEAQLESQCYVKKEKVERRALVATGDRVRRVGHPRSIRAIERRGRASCGHAQTLHPLPGRALARDALLPGTGHSNGVVGAGRCETGSERVARLERGFWRSRTCSGRTFTRPTHIMSTTNGSRPTDGRRRAARETSFAREELHIERLFTQVRYSLQSPGSMHGSDQLPRVSRRHHGHAQRRSG